MDGDAWGKVATEGVKHPFLVMLNEPGESHRPPSAVRKQRDDEWVAIISRKKVAAFVVKIDGTFHLSFTDIPFVVPEALLRKMESLAKTYNEVSPFKLTINEWRINSIAASSIE